MGLSEELGISNIRVNALQRAVQWLGATRIGTTVFSKVLGPLDRAAHRMSGGKFTLARVFGAFPVIILGTIGARTGQQRVNPVNAIPVGDDVALVGSNYGSGVAPGWAHNLRANPAATIASVGDLIDVVATEVDGHLYEDVFDAAIRIYAGYATYRCHGGNKIPVFLLKLRREL